MNITETIEALSGEVERQAEHLAAPKTGMQVPFHGDFANCPPSTIGRLRWWVRALREANK